MTVLDPRDIDRFGKLLGLLGSNHDGERAAAAYQATRFLSARSLGWPDVAEMLKAPPVVIRQPPRAEPPRCHQVDARLCLRSGINWKRHERDFLKQMADALRRPSEKQRDWLDGLVDRANLHMRRRGDADF